MIIDEKKYKRCELNQTALIAYKVVHPLDDSRCMSLNEGHVYWRGAPVHAGPYFSFKSLEYASEHANAMQFTAVAVFTIPPGSEVWEGDEMNGIFISDQIQFMGYLHNFATGEYVPTKGNLITKGLDGNR